ncbi:bifunctional diguanylate cyclase/phosphodiesterase [Xenococcus sp. PCC 7305]|uniref:putative bifunctional diguanylate cyclase/phosphodiesterase n=1 Tax=Xenococcus sp. PCC 7305 TaxID=102125 RepID=UPI000307FEEF|nr:GGDEF domain-containing response regulator [Xenococcus sp. PCC 7305]
MLILEDSQDDAESLVTELEQNGYPTIYQRVDSRGAIEKALNSDIVWDVILADYYLNQFDAITALQLFKEYQLDLPFIIVSGKTGEDIAVEAMKAGVHDYIFKGQLARLVPAVERALREAVLRTEYRKAQERLRYLAYYDLLTGLPNRTLFLEHLSRQLAQSQEEIAAHQECFAVLVISIDRFDVIKYSLGHDLGEQLLIAIAKRLEKFLSNQDVVACTGTNEFAILLTNLDNPSHALKKAEDINIHLTVQFPLQETTIFSTFNIGIAVNTIDYEKPETMLQAADTAMHSVKNNFTNSRVFYNPQMHTQALEKLQLENDLQQAINNKKLHLNYQPIVSLVTGNIECVEALVRWNHDYFGNISPEKIISLSEETGLILPLGQWVLAEACSKLVSWLSQLANRGLSLIMSINLSGIQLSHPDLLFQIDQIMQSLKISGTNLKLEITESTLMHNTPMVFKVLEKLKERGISLCIDDFGTGYSSLSYLRYLPVDTVKIDRSFISPHIDHKNYDILKAIINLVHSLGLSAIAEGIETKTQQDILLSLGCEYGQGYLYSCPLQEEDVLSLYD